MDFFNPTAFFDLVEKNGFPIVMALICWWFMFEAIKLVLGSVVITIKKIIGLIKALGGRVKIMNDDAVLLDKLISDSLDVDILPRKDP
jgi:hypothetical protein